MNHDDAEPPSLRDRETADTRYVPSSYSKRVAVGPFVLILDGDSGGVVKAMSEECFLADRLWIALCSRVAAKCGMRVIGFADRFWRCAGERERCRTFRKFLLKRENVW